MAKLASRYDIHPGFTPLQRTVETSSWTSPSLTDISPARISLWEELMINQIYSPEFRDEAVAMVAEQGYSCAEATAAQENMYVGSCSVTHKSVKYSRK